MGNDKISREEFLIMFREDVANLSRYLPWLESKSGKDVTNRYQDGDKMNQTLAFPVYDSVLMAFLNDASATVFMEQNYRYLYARRNIKTYPDEIALIDRKSVV